MLVGLLEKTELIYGVSLALATKMPSGWTKCEAV